MYSMMTVADLKAELRKRNASVTGKKSDLIARLEDYDKNFGVTDGATVSEPESSIVTPPHNAYKDVNANSNLPPFNRHLIQGFIERYGKTVGKAKQMYENRHLVIARVAVSGDIYFRGQMKASMKKILYVVDVKMQSIHGSQADEMCTIEETHCECAAGAGLEAHCKHVLILMFGIEEIVRHKCITLNQVSTQQLMVFKRPKPFYASPLQCYKISKRNKDINFDPIKEENMPKHYNDYVKNLFINFGQTNAPIKQIIPPANTYAVEWDHSFYCETTGENEILKALFLKDVGKDVIVDIENRTQSQSCCEEWKELRKTHLTASVFHNVCHCKPQNKKHLAQKILSPQKFNTRSTTYGKVQDLNGIKRFEELYGAGVKQSGLFLSLSHPFLGASPDGLFGDDCVVEVKCSYTAKLQAISPNTVPYLELINEDLFLKKNHPYYTQIQGQMFCTERQLCIFIVFTFNDIKIITIQRDEGFIKYMVG